MKFKWWLTTGSNWNCAWLSLTTSCFKKSSFIPNITFLEVKKNQKDFGSFWSLTCDFSQQTYIIKRHKFIGPYFHTDNQPIWSRFSQPTMNNRTRVITWESGLATYPDVYFAPISTPTYHHRPQQLHTQDYYRGIFTYSSSDICHHLPSMPLGFYIEQTGQTFHKAINGCINWYQDSKQVLKAIIKPPRIFCSRPQSCLEKRRR